MWSEYKKNSRSKEKSPMWSYTIHISHCVSDFDDYYYECSFLSLLIIDVMNHKIHILLAFFFYSDCLSPMHYMILSIIGYVGRFNRTTKKKTKICEHLEMIFVLSKQINIGYPSPMKIRINCVFGFEVVFLSLFLLFRSSSFNFFFFLLILFSCFFFSFVDSTAFALMLSPKNINSPSTRFSTCKYN